MSIYSYEHLLDHIFAFQKTLLLKRIIYALPRERGLGICYRRLGLPDE